MTCHLAVFLLLTAVVPGYALWLMEFLMYDSAFLFMIASPGLQRTILRCWDFTAFGLTRWFWFLVLCVRVQYTFMDMAAVMLSNIYTRVSYCILCTV